MIPVTPAEEPAHFDQCVRQPGQRALARLAEEDEITTGKLPPLWRKMLPDLLTRYRRICSYLCLYIPHGTGAPSVDHMIAKSDSPHLAYEWNNYRLACALMNSRKGAVADVLDPFGIEEGWFALELVAFQVVPGERLPPDTAGPIRACRADVCRMLPPERTPTEPPPPAWTWRLHERSHAGVPLPDTPLRGCPDMHDIIHTLETKRTAARREGRQSPVAGSKRPLFGHVQDGIEHREMTERDIAALLGEQVRDALEVCLRELHRLESSSPTVVPAAYRILR